MVRSVSETWAQVVVDVRVASVDRVFHYAIPEALRGRLTVGHRVFVPFGHRRRVEGFVVGLTDEPPPVGEVRAIEGLVDALPAFTPADLAVARWMADYYMCLWVQALQCFLPPGTAVRRAKTVKARELAGYRLAVPPERAAEYAQAIAARAPRQAAVLGRLLAAPDAVLPAAELAREAGYGPLKALCERGLIAAATVRRLRRPDEGLEDAMGGGSVELTEAQRRAVEAAVAGLNEPGGRTLLLHGVTGSGKTEVYLRIIAAALARGKGAILLVPDIALTPQTVGRFRARFQDGVAVLHSRLSDGERFDEWMRIRRGEAQVVVGARSAVFAPVQNLGVIIIDEEHESSYKQDETPRYHAREVAIKRAQAVGGLVVLGSATPSLEAYHAAQSGRMLYVPLPERVQQRPLPRAEVIDMREELLTGNRSLFSRALQAALADTLSRGEQAIMLLNRRGFAAFLLCRECGHVPRCKNCGVSLTYHQDPPGLRCHYCGYAARIPQTCPECGGIYLRPFGAGTQRVEQALSELFPSARIARLDRDTTARKGSHRRILSEFAARRIDVLVGTQMVAKGLDFPAVTLVGVVSADTALHFPDFRAAERTFQLLTQVAGRAGRGDQPGRVLLQTYSPDHYAIQAASRHDYQGFVDRELAYRRRAGYPPFTKVVRVLVTGDDEVAVAKAASAAAQVRVPAGAQIVGPAPAPLSRLKGKTRWHVIVKGASPDVEECTAAVCARLEQAHGTVNIAVDVDPLSLL